MQKVFFPLLVPGSKGLPRVFCTTQTLFCTGATPFRTSARGLLLAGSKRPFAPSPNPLSGTFTFRAISQVRRFPNPGPKVRVTGPKVGVTDRKSELQPGRPPESEPNRPEKCPTWIQVCEGFIRHRPPGPHPRICLALPSSGVDSASTQPLDGQNRQSPIASDFGSRAQIAALFAVLLYPNV